MGKNNIIIITVKVIPISEYEWLEKTFHFVLIDKPFLKILCK